MNTFISLRARLAALLVLLVTGFAPLLSAQQNLFSPPFYFSAPRTAWGKHSALQPGPLPGSKAVFIEAGVEGVPELPAGLRYLMVPDKPESRRTIAQALQAQGLLEDGDVALTFRPGWKNTMAYPHIQMGVSHCGVIHTANGRACNLDMPLDAIYNGEGFASELNSSHYRESEAVHILRPRAYTTADRKAFRNLSGRFLKQVATIRDKGLMPFNSDYLVPRFTALRITPEQSVERFDQLVRSPGSQSSAMKMYCSEFVWHLLSLNGAGKLIFAPLPFVSLDGELGMAEGPLAVLESAGDRLSASRKQELAAQIFASSEAPQLSSGHRQTAIQVAPLMEKLSYYYDMKLGGPAPVEIDGVAMNAIQLARGMDSEIPANYSPTAFLINSFLPSDNPKRKFDYLYTIYYVPDSAVDSARKIANAQASAQND